MTVSNRDFDSDRVNAKEKSKLIFSVLGEKSQDKDLFKGHCNLVI